MGVIAHIWYQNNNPNSADPLQVPRISTAVMWGKLPKPMTHAWVEYLVKSPPADPPPPDFTYAGQSSDSSHPRRREPARCFVPHFAFRGAAGWSRQRRRNTSTRRLLHYLACVTVCASVRILTAGEFPPRHSREHGKVLLTILCTNRRTCSKVWLKSPSLNAWHAVAWWSDGDRGGCVFGTLPLITQTRCRAEI